MTTEDQLLKSKLIHFMKAVEEINPSTKQLIWKSFLRGLFFGLGTTLGVSVVLALLTFILNQIAQVPALHGIIDVTPFEGLIQRK